MRMRNESRRRLRIWFVMLGIGALLGPPINFFIYDKSMESVLRGLMDGLIIAALVGGFSQFVREQWLRSEFRRMNFSANVLVSAFAYLLLFHFGRVLGALIRDPSELGDVTSFLIGPDILRVIPLFYLIAVSVEFVLQMNRLVGHNVLRYFLAGTYHRPKIEERIFMFLDLQDSTAMAEQMGGSAYYELLEHFVNDLTEPILATQGEIHEYVGDEVVITWKRDIGLQGANCLRCFFLIQEVLDASAAEYENRFGRRPRFRAGLHGGQVIAGELGHIKRDIVFVGDAVNTAARLEEFAKTGDYRFVASHTIIDAVTLPDGIEAVYITDHKPRGMESSVRLFEVRRRDAR